MYDPFSNVCLEAMSCGLPVITTRENGASELIEPAINGFIQNNPNSWEELSGLLHKCFNSDLKKMGEAARLKTKDMSLEKNMLDTLEVIQEFRQSSLKVGAIRERN